MLKTNDYLTCLKVHKMLSKKIKGKIIVTMEDDTLVVHIHGLRGLRYTYKYFNVYKETENNRLSYDKIVSVIYYNFKKFVFNSYFRKEM